MILQKCTSKEVLRSTYDHFALPSNPNQLKIFFRGDVWCPQQDGISFIDVGTFPRRGVLLSVGELDILIDCSGAFVLNGGILGQIIFPLQFKSGSNTLQFILSIDKFNLKEPVGLAVRENEDERVASMSQPPELIKYLTTRESILLSKGISIGPRSTNVPAIRASISQLILQADNGSGSSSSTEATLPPITGVLSSSLPSNCSGESNWSTVGLALEKFTSENTFPEVTMLQIRKIADASASASADAGQSIEVEEEVELMAVAQDNDGKMLQLEVITYGVPPEDCSKTTCGDATFLSSGTSGQADLTVKIKFPLPGRYIVRARVSDGSGSIIWKDMTVTVYKKGDAAVRTAPCCRSTPYITAHNLGRPIDRTHFRSKDSEITKKVLNTLGWSSEYWNGVDLEAERLFDYSILAPEMDRFPVETLTCADVRVGGAGGPEVYGLLWAGEDTLGHGKSLLIVPESFQNWATGPADVECAKHWSFSNADNNNNSTASCFVGCTSAMVEKHIQTTGMVDQYSQALVQISYGALHVAPRVRVLPEVQVAKEPIIPGDTAYGYYDTPSRFAVEAAGGTRPWMVLTLANVAQHKIPKHRAWSSGIASGSATITKCFASMYYSVHETGHRLGFKHGQLLKLPAGHGVPADPLSDPAGIQLLSDEGYNQRLDIMSCCKSDYGLFHRTVAGWLKSSKRTVISQQELSQPSTQKINLWPFDRSESRGQHISVAIRRSDDELLLIGFRSMSHWQEQDFKNNKNNDPEDHRLNVRGLQVEYLKRNPNKGDQAWSDRAILDFNVAHGDYPHALPLGPGEISRQSQFSLLKEGRSWYDPASRLLLSFERIAECDYRGTTENMNVYKFSVDGFYGFNGEWPGQEAYTLHDYAGYAELSCAYMSIATAAEPPKGKLEVNIELQEENLNKHSKVGSFSGAQNGACIDSSRSSSCNRGSPGASSAEKIEATKSPSGTQFLSIKVLWNAERDQIASIVWKDRWNRTIQATSAEDFATASGTAFPDTLFLLPALLPITAHILASDGLHTRVEISTEKLSTNKDFLLVARKKYYQLTEKIISESPALILGSVPECSLQLNSKRKQEKALQLWLLITGSLLAALLLIGGVVWLVRRWQQRRQGAELQQRNEEKRRTTTPAALAEAANSTPSSFIIKK